MSNIGLAFSLKNQIGWNSDVLHKYSAGVKKED